MLDIQHNPAVRRRKIRFLEKLLHLEGFCKPQLLAFLLLFNQFTDTNLENFQDSQNNHN